ncbi:hypothetical protein V8C37DRAFT_398296 [Trichoderma ceciliae]
MAPQQPEIDCTFVNLTHDPAEGRGARRTYVRRAVMKNFHRRRNLKKNAFKSEAETATNNLEKPLVSVASIARRMGPQSRVLIPDFSLFEKRKFPEPPMMQMSSFVLRYLCGQATKAAQDLTLVEFIHTPSQYEVGCGSEDTTMSLNPLKTCQGLLQAYSTYKNDHLSISLDKGSLWEMIHQHQEWIYSKARRVNTFTSWELLSAAQATTIYLLLRVKQGENSPAFPNGDIALLFTLGAIFRRLQFDGSLDIAHHAQDGWKQWVFCESFIRIATIYFTLNVVVSMEFGLPCHDPQDWNIDSMPLPATKASWAAENAMDWTKLTSILPSYKQLKWKDLLAPPSLHACPVEMWKESSDELGMIVTMAMTLRAHELQNLLSSFS